LLPLDLKRFFVYPKSAISGPIEILSAPMEHFLHKRAQMDQKRRWRVFTAFAGS
jgi:hypothetical protein